MKILVVGKPNGVDDLLLQVHGNSEIVRAEGVEEAQRMLRWRSVDLVIGSGADLISFRPSLLPAQAVALLEGISQGVCVFDGVGQAVFSNAKMQALAESVRERVRRFCGESLTAVQMERTEGVPTVRTRRFSFTGLDGGQYEVSATPVVDPHGRAVEMVAVVWDVSAQRRLQGKIDAIDQAGRELVSLDLKQFSQLDTQQRLDLLEQRILRSIRDLLHFDNFEIRVIDPKTKRLELIVAYGMPPDADTIELYAVSERNGVCGYVAARGTSYLCADTTNDSRYVHGLTNAKSSLTVPLRLHDRVIGVANFESTRPAAFSEDDKQFAEIFGRYVAIALHVLELLVTERQTTTGQVCQNVLYEITNPLNDLLTQAENLIEDYIGHDDIRLRLRQISENAVRIRDSMRDFTTGKPGLIGAKNFKPSLDDPLLSNKKILVADDEEVILETVSKVLLGHGCKVITAVDGVQAIELLAREPFDLVLSDIKMPGKTGYEVFQAARQADSTIPFIFTTGFGYDPDHAIVKARRTGGVTSVLLKPFKIDQLLHEVRDAIQNRVKPAP